MAKYKDGDRVVVRNDLVVSERYFMDGNINADTFVERMKPFLGQTVTIVSTSYGKYRIKEGPCNWTDEMFLGLESDFYAELEESDCDVNEFLGVYVY